VPVVETLPEGFPLIPFKDLVRSMVSPIMFVSWLGEGQHFMGPTQGELAEQLNLDVTHVKKVGTEDVSMDYDANAEANDVTVTGHRVYTVNFKLTSYAFDKPAYDTLDRLCLRFRYQGVLDQLEDMGLAFARAYDVIPLSASADNRELYVASVDIRFNHLAFDRDTTSAGGTITQVNSGGDIPGTLTP